MVEINNQRKAFLDMLAWSEGTDNGRQKTRNHGYDVIVGGELFTDYPITLVNCHANPKLKINRRRTLPASFPLVGRSFTVRYSKDFPKSQDAVALQQIGRCGALPMIDRRSHRGNRRCSNIWASLPGYGQFEHKADSLIVCDQRSAEIVREIDV